MTNQFAALALKTAQIQKDTVLTKNGMPALSTTANANLDFFAKSGERFSPDLAKVFQEALKEKSDLALRNLLYSRDARGGKGIRETLQKVLVLLSKEYPYILLRSNFLDKVVEVGYWKDLFILIETPEVPLEIKKLVVRKISAGLLNPETNKLVAKWIPLKGPVASMLRSYYRVTPKEFRKKIVELRSDVTERLMCEKRWGDIKYPTVPSKCMNKNKQVFIKHDEDRFNLFLDNVVKGEAKINASVLFPHEVIDSEMYFNKTRDYSVNEVQWKALPNYLEGCSKAILPVVDLSGSMLSLAGLQRYSYYNIAIALGAYISERNEGSFKDLIMTFATNPRFVDLTSCKTLAERVHTIANSDVGYSTNIEATFDLVLNLAKENNLSQEDLPESLLFLSDTQGNFTQTEQRAYDLCRSKFKAAGYTAPKLLFWVLNAKNGNVPVRLDDRGAALINGFSPALMKSLLVDIENYTPYNIMIEALSSDRYSITYYD